MAETTRTEAEDSGRDAPGVMRRGGFYNRHSLPQHEAASYAEPVLRQAAEAVSAPASGQTIVIADYGAAQGRNSLDPMRQAIGIIRRRIPDAVPISVVHTDIPADDFSALFALVENSPDSYLRDTANVFPFAAAEPSTGRFSRPRRCRWDGRRSRYIGSAQRRRQSRGISGRPARTVRPSPRSPGNRRGIGGIFSRIARPSCGRERGWS